MPEIIMIVLLFGSVASVPVACFAVGKLYVRAGFSKVWTVALNAISATSVLGAVLFSGIFASDNIGFSTAGIVTIFAAAILVTTAALLLAFREWPTAAKTSSP